MFNSLTEIEEFSKVLSEFSGKLAVDLDYDNWYFLTPEEELIGPYRTWQRAAEKYELYCAYVIYAPTCHYG